MQQLAAELAQQRAHAEPARLAPRRRREVRSEPLAHRKRGRVAHQRRARAGQRVGAVRLPDACLVEKRVRRALGGVARAGEKGKQSGRKESEGEG